MYLVEMFCCSFHAKFAYMVKMCYEKFVLVYFLFYVAHNVHIHCLLLTGKVGVVKKRSLLLRLVTVTIWNISLKILNSYIALPVRKIGVYTFNSKRG